MPDTLLFPEYGLSNAKLQECNASSSDVRNGKTFYSGDKNKKTGNLVDHGSITDVVSVTRFTDQSLGDRAFIRIQPGIYTTNASSGYPEVSIPFYDMISQLGVDRGQYQYAGGIGSGTDGNGKYYAFNRIPEGFYSKNGADWAPEIRISEKAFLDYLPGASWQMRFVSPNADNFEHQFTFDLPDGAGTYGWGCTGYIFYGNENSGLHFAFADANYPLKYGNNQNFTFHGTTKLAPGSNNFSYRCWGGAINFYYCRIR